MTKKQSFNESNLEKVAVSISMPGSYKEMEKLSKMS